MVRSLRAIPPGQMKGRLPDWLGRLRQAANATFGEIELGLRRAVDDLAVAISREADPDRGPPPDVLWDASERFLEQIQPLFSAVVSAMIAALDAIAAEIGEGALALRERLTREIVLAIERVGEYLAGYVEGGGLVLTVLTELPPDLTCHTGEVAALLSERLIFLPRRIEQVVNDWVTMVHRDIDGWIMVMRASTSEVPAVAPAASKGAPKSETREDALTDRKNALLAAAVELKLKVKGVPDAPSAIYLERLQDKLLSVAKSRGLPIPSALITIDRAVTVPLPDPSALEMAVTQYKRPAPPTDPAEAQTDEGSAPARLCLVLAAGTEREEVWPISDAGLTIGRARSSDVQIRDDAGISRQHATVRFVDGCCTLFDHGSTKGTYIDGHRVDGSVVLVGGERIQMSETRFTIKTRSKAHKG